MKVNFTLTGASDLVKALHRMPEVVSASVQKKALLAGAEPMRREASSRAPRSTVGGQHLADNIVIGTVSARKLEADLQFDQVAVEVGPAKKFFYSYFQEYGTVKHGAQPFMRPAFDVSAQTSLNTILHHMWVSIKVLLPSRGSTNVGGRNL